MVLTYVDFERWVQYSSEDSWTLFPTPPAPSWNVRESGRKKRSVVHISQMIDGKKVQE